MKKTANDATTTITRLIGGYPTEPSAAFTHALETALADALREREISEADREFLREIANAILAREASAPDRLVQNWLPLEAKAKGAIQRAAIIALAVRFSREVGPEFKWNDLVLRANPSAVRSLLDASVIDVKVLKHIMDNAIVQFYESGALDVLLDAKHPLPREMWVATRALSNRHEGLIGRAEAIVDSFAYDKAKDAPRWLATLMAQEPHLSTEIARHLLRDRKTVVRFVDSLVAVRPAKKSSATDKQDELYSIRSALSSVLEECEAAIAQSKRTAETAAMVVGTLAMKTVGIQEPGSNLAFEVIEQAVNNVAGMRIVQALQAADIGEPRRGATEIPIVSFRSGVTKAVEAYLQRLPMSGEEADGTRRATYERYVGRKDVVQELLPLIEMNDARQLLPRLEAALFNAGLRQLEEPNSTVVFDSKFHSSTGRPLVTGDRAIVVNTGWRLGDGSDAITLVKARVREV